MSQERDKLLLSEFKKVAAKNGAAPYSNLDDSFTQKFDFFIKRYEEIMVVTGTHIPPYRWSYHRIGLLTKGEAHYTCGIYRFTAKKNTLIIIPARVITTSDWNTAACGFHLLFKSDFLLQNNLSVKAFENKAILQPSIQPYLSLDEGSAHMLSQLFETILKEKEGTDPLKNELIALKILELVISCERLHIAGKDIGNSYQSSKLLKNFTVLIDQHITEEHSVGFYASKLHVHPNYLNAVIKAATGVTAKESIQNRILLEAKYLLHTTSFSVKEIASQLGFEDPNYFTSFFKRLEQTSPQAYRSLYV